MEDSLRSFYSKNGVRTLQRPSYYFPSPHLLHISSISRNFNRLIIHSRIITSSSTSSSSSKTTSISLPQKPLKFPDQPPPQPEPEPQTSPDFDFQSKFRDKILYLDSIGIDFFSLMDDDADYPLNLILSSSLNDMKATVEFIRSMGFTALEFRRICGMCPEILNCKISDIARVFTFLLREANVMGSDLRRVINRRPRLLACDVEKRLRPTLYFLQSLGISEVQRYTFLLSCSVEDKFIPRIEYLEKIGFSYGDVVSMVRRFPQLFCYSIKHNFEPKFDYFVVEMGRDLTELREFPQYFSFSLENRIKPRHRYCVEKGVCFPLPVMLKMHEKQFRDTLEVCRSSSPPLRTSPLWCTDSSSSYIKNNSLPRELIFGEKLKLLLVHLQIFNRVIVQRIGDLQIRVALISGETGTRIEDETADAIAQALQAHMEVQKKLNELIEVQSCRDILQLIIEAQKRIYRL